MAQDHAPEHDAHGFGLGYIPDDYDHRDKLLGELYGMQRLSMQEIYQKLTDADKHEKFTLEDSCPPVYNQYDLGSCVSNAVTAALRFAWQNSFQHISTPYEKFDPSRLWIYYYARLLANNRKDLEFRDTGASIRDTLKVLKNKGVCEEQAWPYLTEEEARKVGALQEETKDEDAMPLDCRAGIVPDGANDESIKKFFDFGFEYYRIHSLTDDLNDKSLVTNTVVKQMCACLAEGFPIIFGFSIYENVYFQDSDNWEGDVFKPKIEKLESLGKLRGGHAVLAVGYDHKNELFRCMNSWGPKWKNNGFFWMPFSWFEHAGTIKVEVDGKPGTREVRPAYDLWVIRPNLAPLLRDHDPA